MKTIKWAMQEPEHESWHSSWYCHPEGLNCRPYRLTTPQSYHDFHDPFRGRLESREAAAAKETVLTEPPIPGDGAQRLAHDEDLGL